MIVSTSNVDTAWTELILRLLDCEPRKSRNGPVYEIIGTQVAISDPTRCWLWNSGRKASARYAAAELLWYLSGSNDGKMISAYAPSYAQFLDEDGTAHGAYGRRLRNAGFDQITAVLRLLMHVPDTRQAVAQIWAPYDLRKIVDGSGSPDLPCTLSLQWLLRNGYLHAVTNMRSNDAWLGFPYDVWCFTAIQRLLAGALLAKPGIYVHNVGSMHLYLKDAERARADVAERSRGGAAPKSIFTGFGRIYTSWPGDSITLMQAIDQAAVEEESARLGVGVRESALPRGSLLRECVELCATKFGGPPPGDVRLHV